MVLHVEPCRKDVRLPKQLQRAMAAEAEASREARAKVHLMYQSILTISIQNIFLLLKS